MNHVTHHPASVLIVDDEESVRRYVDRILTLGGYRTRVAIDCADAIVAASLERFDLLLTDVMMPEMSGAALAARLRQTDPGLKVLYLTGHADQLFKDKPSPALDAREAFLEKPCGATALQQAVSLAITGSTASSIRRPASAGWAGERAAPALTPTPAPPAAVRRDDEKLRHDFRNQLAIIRGFSELLIAQAAPADPRRQDFDEIHRAAVTALELLARLYPN